MNIGEKIRRGKELKGISMEVFLVGWLVFVWFGLGLGLFCFCLFVYFLLIFENFIQYILS